MYETCTLGHGRLGGSSPRICKHQLDSQSSGFGSIAVLSAHALQALRQNSCAWAAFSHFSTIRTVFLIASVWPSIFLFHLAMRLPTMIDFFSGSSSELARSRVWMKGFF